MAQLKNTKTGFITNDIGEWDKSVYKPESWEVYNPSQNTGTVNLGNTSARVTVEPKTNLASDINPIQETDDNLAGAGQRFGVDLAETSQPPAENLNKIKDSVIKQAQDFGNNVLANENYVNAVFKSFGGRDANKNELLEFTGKGVQDVFDAITTGLGGGVPYEKKEGDMTGGDKTDETSRVQQPMTVNDYINNLSANISEQTEGATAQLTTAQTKVREIQAQLDAYEELFAATNLADTTEAVGIKKEAREKIDIQKNKPMLQATADARINAIAQEANERLEKIGDENALRNAQDAYDYTMLTIQQRMYSGMAADAQSLINQVSDQLYRNETLRINYLQLQESIDSRTANDLRIEAQHADEMRVSGYVPIPADQVDDMAYEYGASRIYTNPVTGQSWLSPETETEDSTKWGVVGTDIYGNNIYGFVNTATGQVQEYTPGISTSGAVGGQCGDYLHNIMQGTPKFGDTWESKQSAMNTSAEDFAANPQVGDIVAFKTNMPAGHVAAVVAVDKANGTFTITESNYGLDEKISNNRVIELNNKDILGVYRGATFKPNSNIEPITKQNIVSINGKDYQLKSDGSLEEIKIPTSSDTLKADKLAEEKADEVLKLKNHTGLPIATGFYLGRGQLAVDPEKLSAKSDFVASIDQIVSSLSLDALIAAKARGATFGALSDTEMQILSKSSTKIGTWTRKNKKGETTGYATSEKNMKDELDKIYKTLNSYLERTEDSAPQTSANSTPISTGEQFSVGTIIVDGDGKKYKIINSNGDVEEII